MKQNTISLLKFKKLQMRLGLPKWQVIGLLESLWQSTLTNAPAGDIGHLPNDDIAVSMEWSDDPDTLIGILVDTGWLDNDPTHRLLVHDWEDHCPTFLKGNFVKHGKQFAKPTSQPAKQPAKQPAEHGATKPSPAQPNPANPIQGRESASSRGKKVSYTDQDMDTAQWMFALIKKVIPNEDAPKNFDAWGNELRLMREQDHRTDEQIREMFLWANQEQFWRTRVRSPAKLRKHWGELNAQKTENSNGRKRNGRQAHYTGAGVDYDPDRPLSDNF